MKWKMLENIHTHTHPFYKILLFDIADRSCLHAIPNTYYYALMTSSKSAILGGRSSNLWYACVSVCVAFFATFVWDFFLCLCAIEFMHRNSTPLLYVGAAAFFVLIYMYSRTVQLHQYSHLGACVGGCRALCIYASAAVVVAAIFWHWSENTMFRLPSVPKY